MTARHFTGYTIIETVIALGIFSIVLLVISGLFSHFVASQRRDIGEKAVQEEMRFALELFSREARTAYASTFAVTGTGEQITFRNQNGVCAAYRLQSNAWQRAESSASGPCESQTYGVFGSLTTNKVQLTTLRFLIPANISSGSIMQRQGFISVIVTATPSFEAVPPLEMQSTITSRQIAVYPGP